MPSRAPRVTPATLMLGDLVRTDRHQHREVAADSTLAEAVKVLARAHQGLVWARQRQVNQLRSTLCEFYPQALEAFSGELGERDALAVLACAPSPAGPAVVERNGSRGPNPGPVPRCPMIERVPSSTCCWSHDRASRR